MTTILGILNFSYCFFFFLDKLSFGSVLFRTHSLYSFSSSCSLHSAVIQLWLDKVQGNISVVLSVACFVFQYVMFSWATERDVCLYCLSRMCCSSLPGPFDLYYQLTQMIFSFISWDNLSIGESEVLKASTINVAGTIMLLLIVFLLQNREQLRYYCDIIVIYIYIYLFIHIYMHMCAYVCVYEVTFLISSVSFSFEFYFIIIYYNSFVCLLLGYIFMEYPFSSIFTLRQYLSLIWWYLSWKQRKLHPTLFF